MKKMNKKGVSPVIATVLLVSMAIVLALIIFIWARAFISEGGEKMGETIKASCEKVNIEVEAFQDRVLVKNSGNIPLYGVKVMKVSFGSTTKLNEFEESISGGESVSISEGINLDEGEDIIVIPMLLGESGEEKKVFACDNDFGIKASVK